MKKYLIVLIILFILMGVFNVDILGRSIKDIQARMTGQVKYRVNVVKGIVESENINKTYNCHIAGETVVYPNIPTFSRNPKLQSGDKVTIEFINGCRETPAILAPEDIRERPDTTLPIVGDLIVASYNLSRIWRCAGISSTIIDTLLIPQYPTGATIANGNLISVGYVPAFGDVRICVHDGFSATITDYYIPPEGATAGVSGLAFDGTNLISSDWFVGKIYVHNGISAGILASFNSPNPGARFPRGLTVIGGNLVSMDANSDKIYIHVGITAATSDSFVSPNAQPNGLTNDGTNLISGDNGTYGVEDDVIYVHSGITVAITRNFAAPVGCRRINGLAFFE